MVSVKANMQRFLWLFLFPVLLLPLGAQQPRLQMNLPDLAARARQVSDVTLDGTVLKLGLAFLNHGGSGLNAQDRAMLSKLRGIYVKTFDFDHAPRLTDPALAAIRKQLHGSGWSRIATVRTTGRDSDHESTEVYVSTSSDGSILGMAILCREPKELTVVNIVGSITPQELTQLGGNLGIPNLKTENH